MGKIRKGSKTKWWGPKKPLINRLREKQRLMRLRLQESVFPDCLPAQDDILAVLLGNTAPSETGLIVDESGNGNDAQLVESPCCSFFGTSYAVGNNDNLHDGNTLNCQLIINPSSSGSPRIIAGKGKTGTGFREILIYQHWVNNIHITFYDSLDTIHAVSTTKTLTNNSWNKVDVNIEMNKISIAINDVNEEFAIGNVGIINRSVSNISIGAGDNGAYLFQGSIAKVKIGYAEYNLAEGGLCESLINVGTAGGNASLINAIMPSTRTNLADTHHYNNLNDIDIYSNGVEGEEIRIPSGISFSQSGYSLESTNLTGVWDNNGGAKIELPATLKAVIDGDITSPLSYEDWQTLYGTSPNYSALSNTKEYEHKRMVFYDKYLSNEELIKALKCIKASEGSDILRDANGDPLRDANGILLIPSS